MAQKPRVLLINPSGRKLLDTLSKEYPEYTWVLMMRDTREVCVGLKDGVPVIYGTDYDNLKDNLTL